MWLQPGDQLLDVALGLPGGRVEDVVEVGVRQDGSEEAKAGEVDAASSDEVEGERLAAAKSRAGALERRPSANLSSEIIARATSKERAERVLAASRHSKVESSEAFATTFPVPSRARRTNGASRRHGLVRRVDELERRINRLEGRLKRPRR